MQTAIRIKTTVLPGHRIEVCAPELPEGANIEITVVPSLNGHEAEKRYSMAEIAAQAGEGPRLFATWEEYEKALQEEKDAWER